MDIRELGRLDLNLLVALEALLEERSVSLAAQRLFVTQSAMSKTLARLRVLFDDPLFVRKASQMIPTPRAEGLARSLPAVLRAVQDMVQPQEFNAASYAGQFNLVVQGHMGVWFLPALMQRLTETAPNIRITAHTRSTNYFDQLADGSLDFVLQVERNTYPQDVELTTLAFAVPSLLARKGHPLEHEELTLERVMAYPQAALSATDLSEVRFHSGDNSALLAYQLALVPTFETDDLQTAIQVVRESDFLFPAPPLFLEQFDVGRHLIALPIPGSEKISIKYVAVRHKRVQNSPGHEFMFQEILATTEMFRSRFGLPSLPELRKLRNLDY